MKNTPKMLARKYRPQRFSDVVGQDVFVQMLTTALQQHRLAQGIILTGTRGVGKTTLARLIAQSLHCANFNGEPCGNCRSCSAYVQESHPDVIEMDAASNTGVDDMRLVIDSCQYAGLMGTHRVFIIDEAHMLSKNAFNALLKTLEEPPAHIVFILATTEVQKIPSTIISRCQTFSLRRVSLSTMKDALEKVCLQENINITEQALYQIAIHSAGSMRDALCLLEQSTLISVDIIEAEHVLCFLGIPPQEDVATLMVFLRNDVHKARAWIKQYYDRGYDPVHMVKSILYYAYDACQQALEKNTDAAYWETLWHLATKGVSEVEQHPFPFLALDMLVLRMHYMGNLPLPHHIAHVLAQPNNEVKQKKVETELSPLIKEEKNNEPPPSFSALIEAIRKAKEVRLHAHLTRDVAFLAWEDKILRLSWVNTDVPIPDFFTSALEKFMLAWTKKQWAVSWEKKKEGDSSLYVQQTLQEEKHRASVIAEPIVSHILTSFPHAVIEKITPLCSNHSKE